MDTKAKDLKRLERDYLASKQQVQENPTLSFEKKQLQIKALGDEYFARHRELEKEEGRNGV
jgi:hypothetical protein